MLRLGHNICDSMPPLVRVMFESLLESSNTKGFHSKSPYRSSNLPYLIKTPPQHVRTQSPSRSHLTPLLLHRTERTPKSPPIPRPDPILQPHRRQLFLGLEHLGVLVRARQQAHAYGPADCFCDFALVDGAEAGLAAVFDPAGCGCVFGHHGEILWGGDGEGRGVSGSFHQQ